MERARVDRPRALGEDRHVGTRADGQRSAFDAEDLRRVASEQLDEARRAADRGALRVRADARSRARESDRRDREQLRLLVEGVRRVIGREDVDRAVAHAGAQRGRIALGAQRRFDFRARAIVVEAIVVQQADGAASPRRSRGRRASAPSA